MPYSKKTIFATLGILTISLCCASSDRASLCSTGGEKQVDYNELTFKVFLIRKKSEEIHHRPLGEYVAKKRDHLNDVFDPKILLNAFPRLKLKENTTLYYGFRGAPMGDGMGYVFVVEDGKPVVLSSPEVYKKYIGFERCGDGYLQYVLFREELDLLSLKWHANLSQSWFVPSRQGFERICGLKERFPQYYHTGRWYGSFLPEYPAEKDRDISFWRSFKFSIRSYAPSVTVEGERARIQYYRFSPWGGIYPSEYLMDTVTGTLFQESGQWAFPIYRKGEFVVPFSCGSMI